MSSSSTPVHGVFPYLRVRSATEAIAFYSDVFGAKERFRLSEPSGRVGHCELDLGNAVLMLSDEYPEFGILGPQTPGASGCLIHLHVENADALAAKAVAAGAMMIREPADAFYGERSCTIRDPFGHEWMLGHEIETVTHVEMQRRFTAMFGEQQ
jgi:PhnB protein